MGLRFLTSGLTLLVLTSSLIISCASPSQRPRAVQASAPTSEPSTHPAHPAQPTAKSCEEDIEDYIASIDARAEALPARSHVQGEDATSGFINELRGPGKTVLRVRSAWNGGCCNPGELSDFYLRDGQVVAVIDATMPPLVGDAVLHGQEPTARTITSRRVFCGPQIDQADKKARQAVEELIDDVEHPQD